MRRPNGMDKGRAPLAAVAAAVAAALGGTERPVLPLHKAAKPSPPGAGTKRGKQARPSGSIQLWRVAVLLVLASLMAAAAAAAAVGGYAASILHERPESLAAAAAEVQEAVRSAGGTAAATAGHGGSDLMPGNYTVVVMSCEPAVMGLCVHEASILACLAVDRHAAA